jgi:hypothetical protein
MMYVDTFLEDETMHQNLTEVVFLLGSSLFATARSTSPSGHDDIEIIGGWKTEAEE